MANLPLLKNIIFTAMKGGAALILILVTIVSAVLIHKNKIEREYDDIDRLSDGLSGVKQYLSPGIPITFHGPADKKTLHFWTRNLLAPTYVALSTAHFDTVLSIYPADTPDSTLSIDTTAHKVLWRNRDAGYYYFLTSGNTHAFRK